MYNNYDDNELVFLVKENNEEAKDILYEKYSYIIDIIIKKYLNMAHTLGVEYNDLHQEALIGLVDAINCFDDSKNASLKTFISLCVERKLVGAIKRAGRIKNKIIYDSWSLEHQYSQYDQPLKDIISDNNENNPLVNIEKEESVNELVTNIKKELSDSEYEVFSLMISGLNYTQIATLLDKQPKQIDNAIQRIKNKVKKILDK